MQQKTSLYTTISVCLLCEQMKLCLCCENMDTTALSIFDLFGIAARLTSLIKTRLHSNSGSRCGNTWTIKHGESNDRVQEPRKLEFASGEAPSRYAEPKPATPPQPAYITLQVPSGGRTKVAKRNLHLTADISAGFLTFLARRVPSVEFPSCYSQRAAPTRRTSWTLGVSDDGLVKTGCTALYGHGSKQRCCQLIPLPFSSRKMQSAGGFFDKEANGAF